MAMEITDWLIWGTSVSMHIPTDFSTWGSRYLSLQFRIFQTTLRLLFFLLEIYLYSVRTRRLLVVSTHLPTKLNWRCLCRIRTLRDYGSYLWYRCISLDDQPCLLFWSPNELISNKSQLRNWKIPRKAVNQKIRISGSNFGPLFELLYRYVWVWPCFNIFFFFIEFQFSNFITILDYDFFIFYFLTTTDFKGTYRITYIWYPALITREVFILKNKLSLCDWQNGNDLSKL